MGETDNLAEAVQRRLEGHKALREWIIGRLGGQWSDLPDQVLLVLADQPALAFQLMLINAVNDLGVQIELLSQAFTQPTKQTREDRYPPLLLRPDAAAKRVGLSRGRIYELIAEGEIESVKDGSARFIPIESLRAWVDRLIAKKLKE